MGDSLVHSDAYVKIIIDIHQMFGNPVPELGEGIADRSRAAREQQYLKGVRRLCLALAVRAASARNCEIFRVWRVISIADMLPLREPHAASSHVCRCLGIPQESDSRTIASKRG